MIPVAVSACLTAALAVSSGATAEPETRTQQVAQADSPPAMEQTRPEADLAALVRGNTAFALDLYGRLRGAEGNLFMSPHSLSTALAMTWAGAQGETARQMAETLRLELPSDRVHAAFAALSAALAERAEVAGDEAGSGFTLNVTNALWTQSDFTFLDDFLHLVREQYAAGANGVDFINATEAARRTINTWVSEQTGARIPELIPEGVLDDLTRLVLTNAIYFNASWATPFRAEATEPGQFRTAAGESALVPMMTGTLRAGFGELDGVTVVEVPYLGGQVVMTIVMPAEGALAEVEAALDADALRRLLDAVHPERIALTMPKFETGSALRLTETLQALGMTDAFDMERADFSAMTGRRDLLISAVLHEANITVDESGTEAAAATAVVMSLRSARPVEPRAVRVDRPFIYLIRDRETGAILFLGRLIDP